jgi:hypothetical protein
MQLIFDEHEFPYWEIKMFDQYVSDHSTDITITLQSQIDSLQKVSYQKIREGSS